MKGGMGQGARLPLQDRTGPATPSPPAGEDIGAATAAVEPPPGTPCWLSVRSGINVGGVVLGWRQSPDGAWWALVSAWVPRDDVQRR